MPYRLPEDRKTELEEQVKRGARLLDAVEPDWYLKVLMSELDLASCFKCVLGQLYKTFGIGIRKLFDGSVVDDGAYERAAMHGFCLGDNDPLPVQAEGTEYRFLQERWKEAIRTRREKRVTRVL